MSEGAISTTAVMNPASAKSAELLTRELAVRRVPHMPRKRNRRSVAACMKRMTALVPAFPVLASRTRCRTPRPRGEIDTSSQARSHDAYRRT